MLGIGGGELFFIIIVVLMLFGSDKVPEIARTIGRGMQQLKHATHEIKTEIHKSADIDDIKRTLNDVGHAGNNLSANITRELDQVKEDIEDMEGPIKRVN